LHIGPGGLYLGQGAGDQHQAGSLIGEREGNDLADSSARPGNDGDFAFELQGFRRLRMT